MLQRLFKLVDFDPQNNRVKQHDTPAVTILDRDPNATPCQQKWHYRSVLGCLLYIQAMVRPDITFAVQQCARFCIDPSLEHEQAVKRICRFLWTLFVLSSTALSSAAELIESRVPGMRELTLRNGFVDFCGPYLCLVPPPTMHSAAPELIESRQTS